jgi:hypothetical protein
VKTTRKVRIITEHVIVFDTDLNSIPVGLGPSFGLGEAIIDAFVKSLRRANKRPKGRGVEAKAVEVLPGGRINIRLDFRK